MGSKDEKMSETEVATINKTIAKERLVKYYIVFLFTVISIIVSITLYVADKPSRIEVKDLINEKIDARINSIENKLNNIEIYLREKK